MSRTLITATIVTSAAVALTSCGDGAHELPQTRASQTPPGSATQTAEQAIAQRLDGLYTAPIAGKRLRETLPGIHLPGGTWALRIDVAGRTLRLIPPEGGDITLRVTGVDASRLRLAPDTACESRAGRAAASHFAWSRTDAFVRLQTIRAPCRSDAALLTLVPWRASWALTPRR